MPRLPRIDIPGLLYHVTNRGGNKKSIFQEAADFQRFLQLILITADEFPFHLHAYCLMTNHYHLLLEMKQHSLSRAIQYLNGCYGSFFNRKYKHTGHLFQGRFHSIPVQEDIYLTVVSRYIHLNPVRAGIVARPEDYPWSNYRAVVEGRADPIADPSFILGYFGKDISRQRQNYRTFVEDYIDKTEMISSEGLWRLRSWGRPKQLGL